MQQIHSSLKDLLKSIREEEIRDDIGKKKIADLSVHATMALDDQSRLPGPHHSSLRAALQDAILHFEVSHPKMTAIMQSINSTLSDMLGI